AGLHRRDVAACMRLREAVAALPLPRRDARDHPLLQLLAPEEEDGLAREPRDQHEQRRRAARARDLLHQHRVRNEIAAVAALLLRGGEADAPGRAGGPEAPPPIPPPPRPPRPRAARSRRRRTAAAPCGAPRARATGRSSPSPDQALSSSAVWTSATRD